MTRLQCVPQRGGQEGEAAMCVCVAMCGEIREDAARAAMDREVEVLGRLEGKALTRIVCVSAGFLV